MADLKRFEPKELSSVAAAQGSKFQREILQLLNLIKKTSRSVILVRSGIRNARAAKEFLELTGELKIPVLTGRRSADVVPYIYSIFLAILAPMGKEVPTSLFRTVIC